MKSKRSHRVVIAVKTLIMAVLPIVTFSIGIFVSQLTSEQPAVISTNLDQSLGVKCEVVETHIVKYIDRPVTEIKYIDRIKNIPVELSNFSDLDGLKLWLEDKTSASTVFFQPPDTTVDCDDYALEL